MIADTENHAAAPSQKTQPKKGEPVVTLVPTREEFLRTFEKVAQRIEPEEFSGWGFSPNPAGDG